VRRAADNRRHRFTYFGEEARSLRDALFVPLGDKVAQALRLLAREGILVGDRILDGLQHPSGANAERIAYMPERKPKAALSPKTRAEVIDAARAALRRKMGVLLAEMPANARPG